MKKSQITYEVTTKNTANDPQKILQMYDLLIIYFGLIMSIASLKKPKS